MTAPLFLGHTLTEPYGDLDALLSGIPLGAPEQTLRDYLTNQQRVVNVRTFGATGNGIDNDTVAFQAAIDDVALVVPTGAGQSFGGGVVFVPQGHYSLDGIVLKAGVRIIGENTQAVYLMARTGNPAQGLITLDTGVVQRVAVGQMTLQGSSSNASQHGMYLHAVPTLQAGVTQGGMWYFDLFDLDIAGFAGEQIWLHGGGDDHRGPHQFGKFTRVDVTTNTTKRALRISGQVSQIDFDAGCRFDGPGNGLGTENILIERTVDNNGNNNGDNSPGSLNFFCSCQSNTTLVRCERGIGIAFRSAHFEESSNFGLKFDVSALQCVVDGCYFANVGHNGGITGVAVRSQGGSNVTVLNNYFAGTTDIHYSGDGPPDRMHVEGTHYYGGGRIITHNVFRDVAFVSTSGTTAMGGTEVVDATAGNIVRTLPIPAGPGALSGFRVTIKKIDATSHTVTVLNAQDGFGVDTVLNVGNEWREFEWDFTNNFWRVVGRGGSFPAVVTAGAAGLSATQSTPWGFISAGDFNTLVALVNNLYSACRANGLVT